MSSIQTVSVGESGDVPIPVSLRQLAGIEAGAMVTVEARDGAIVIRPVSDEVEIYGPERKAEFLLSNAIDDADYAAARAEVYRLGLNPDDIPHVPPKGA